MEENISENDSELYHIIIIKDDFLHKIASHLEIALFIENLHMFIN